MNYLISMYIDNELSLEEKIAFVERVHISSSFKKDAIALLEQEKILHTALNLEAPVLPEPDVTEKRKLKLVPHTVGLAMAACLLVIFTFLFVDFSSDDIKNIEVVPQTSTSLQRFVIYEENAQSAAITGSFTNWEKVPLTRAGDSGYWHVTLEVKPGEHRYSYIVDGTRQLADPTIATKESDDFGAENSILIVEI